MKYRLSVSGWYIALSGSIIDIATINQRFSKKRSVYRNIIEELQKGTAILKIAKEYGITR